MAESSTSPSYATLADLLSEYNRRVDAEAIVDFADSFSFREEFLYQWLGYQVVRRETDLQRVREAVELYGLLLFLQRETTSTVLQADARNHFAFCPRDQVRPQVRVVIMKAFDSSSYNDAAEANEHAHALWKAVVDMFDYETPQPRLSDHYYTTRRVMLGLFGVDEASVAKAAVEVSLLVKCAAQLDAFIGAAPMSAIRRLQLISTSTPMHDDNTERTRFLFMGVRTDIDLELQRPEELLERLAPWILSPVQTRRLTVPVSLRWTEADAEAFVKLLNHNRYYELKLQVETEHALGLAFMMLTKLRTVTNMRIELKIASTWETEFLPLTGPAPVWTDSTVRSLYLHVKETPKMADFVKSMKALLTNPDAKDALARCGDVGLHTTVNEAREDDYAVLGELLQEIGSHVKVLQTDSYSSSEFFNDFTYMTSPDSFRLGPIMVACPNLRMLNVQGALFEDLADLYEHGVCRPQSLQVQWATEESTLALIQALGNPDLKIAQHLLEFSTRQDAEAVFQGFAELLTRNKSVRYLRLGRRPAGDALLGRLKGFHNERLAPGGAQLSTILDLLANKNDARAIHARDCMDDDVLESIAQFAGPSLCRQIRFR